MDEYTIEWLRVGNETRSIRDDMRGNTIIIIMTDNEGNNNEMERIYYFQYGVKGECSGKRNRGRKRYCLMDNMIRWTGYDTDK